MTALDPTLVADVKRLEGFDPVAFWDYQQWTNGYGTRAHFPHERITVATAEVRLTIELAAAQASVDSLGISMPPGVRKALIDLTFNSGFGWSHAGLGIALRQEDWPAVREHILEYDMAGGKVNTALEARRKEEVSWFNEPAPRAIVEAAVSPAPVHQATGPFYPSNDVAPPPPPLTPPTPPGPPSSRPRVVPWA